MEDELAFTVFKERVVFIKPRWECKKKYAETNQLPHAKAAKDAKKTGNDDHR